MSNREDSIGSGGSDFEKIFNDDDAYIQDIDPNFFDSPFSIEENTTTTTTTKKKKKKEKGQGLCLRD